MESKISFAATPRKKIRSIQMTALIDVTFLLLIFFMLSTTFADLESMELSLPGEAKAAVSSANTMQIYITDVGKFYLAGQVFDEDQLFDELQRRFATRADTKVMLYSAPQISVQTLVSAMDVIYLAGGQSLALASATSPAAPNL